MAEEKRHGLLIDYEYCTGCYTCQVACAQEYRRPKDQIGMQVIETITMLPNGRPYLAFIPFPTENCTLCAGRTRKGLEPTCVKHCMANVIRHGPVEELAKDFIKKRRMVLWAPR